MNEIPKEVRLSPPIAAESKLHKTGEGIKDLIQRSFKPFRCVVKISAVGQIQFTVMKKKRTPIYTEPGIPLEVLEDIRCITELLFSVRKVLEKQGYRLDPW